VAKYSPSIYFQRKDFDLFKIAFYRVILMRNEKQLVEYKTDKIFLHLLLVSIVQYE